VFRWQHLGDGSWLGVDGGQWYRVWGTASGAVATHATGVNRDPSLNALTFVGERRAVYEPGATETLTVESNGSREDFEQFFRLDWDADGVEREILQRGPELEPYLGALSGLRLLRPSSPTEMLFTFLCTPNNNMPRIVQMVRHLSTYGPVLAEVDGRPLHRFPDVARIAAIPEADLRAKAFGYRGGTIPGVARQLLSRGGDEYIASLKEVPYEEANAALCTLKGIGPKLADCIALFALHHTESVPVDTHLWQAATRLYFPQWKGQNLTEVRYRAVSQFIRNRFGKLTGWAHQYLFFDNVLNWRSRK